LRPTDEERGRKTGYLWSGSNIYTGGKYVSDGVWSSSAEDEQLGIVPMAKRMVELDPSLDLGAVIGALVSTPIAAPVAPVEPTDGPKTVDNVKALQADLNKLGSDLTIDGSIGANTRRAIRAFQRAHGLNDDGIAGPDTWAAITAALKTPDTATAAVAKVVEQPEHKGPTLGEAAMAFLAHLKTDLQSLRANPNG
jgi:hypothetical protein